MLFADDDDDNGGTQLAASPEFEFRRARNPQSPEPRLLSADQLFFNGFILPLDHLHIGKPDPKPTLDGSFAALPASGSRRWRDIFRRENGKTGSIVRAKEERRSARTRNSAELKINIWPFSRSRSAGTTGPRLPRTQSGAPPGRTVNSAPCSRSNSSVKGSTSPGRVGVRLGRTSPVWELRPPAAGNKAKISSARRRMVPENHLSCRSGGGNLFGLRLLFAKKIF